jgi:hypothetical protein
MLITLSLLSTLGACSEHIERFRASFPEGLLVEGDPDPATLDKVVSAGLNLDWFAPRVLTATALAEYERVTVDTLISLIGGMEAVSC